MQEVVIEGQDKIFKDVIEPLESVSVNMIPTAKQDIRELGSPQEVCALYTHWHFLKYKPVGTDFCFFSSFLIQNLYVQ